MIKLSSVMIPISMLTFPGTLINSGGKLSVHQRSIILYTIMENRKYFYNNKIIDITLL